MKTECNQAPRFNHQFTGKKKNAREELVNNITKIESDNTEIQKFCKTLRNSSKSKQHEIKGKEELVKVLEDVRDTLGM